MRITDMFSSYIAGYEKPDHPLPDAVRKIVGDKPILVFHGAGLFGQRQRILAEFPGCTDIIEATGQQDVVNCEISADIPNQGGFSVPFYASLISRQGRRHHEIHAFIAVSRVQRDDEKPFSPLLEKDFLEGLAVEYVRTKSISGQSDYIDITKDFKRAGEGGFFLADIGTSVLRKIRRAMVPELESQSFFHVLDVSADESKLWDRNEVVIAQLLIFINRRPTELSK